LAAIEFELTSADFVAFNLHHAGTSEFLARQRRRTRIAISVAGFVVLALLIGIGFGDPVGGLVVAVVTAAFMWFIFPRLWQRSIERNVRRASAGDGLGTPGFRVLTIDDDGLHESGAGVALSTTWASIERVDLAPGHVFIYFGPQAAFVVPRSVGAERIDALLHEIDAHRPGL
jgi:hypothetical protein